MHEVFTEDEVKKSETPQTGAANKGRVPGRASDLYKSLNSSSKCNDIVQKRENCDTSSILLLPQKGIHR